MKDLERELLKYLKERNWHKPRPADLAKSISIEAAELLELFQWGDRDVSSVKKDKKMMEKVRYELADVIIYCIGMALLLGLDTKKTVREKLEMVKKKYPAKAVRRPLGKRNPGTLSAYLKIRDEHRRAK